MVKNKCYVFLAASFLTCLLLVPRHFLTGENSFTIDSIPGLVNPPLCVNRVFSPEVWFTRSCNKLLHRDLLSLNIALCVLAVYA